MSEKHCLCIHGHFYQPPRDNPWIDLIERQESASPFHDWNQRIHHECYLPNSRARILDGENHVVDIVNNFEKMSFNFGPTLLSWMEGAHPETYARIIEADRLSVERRGGHGNAIAQCYNHMIMPLANARDKVTQVRWGVADFEYRFGRRPEGMWLPETACNDETLEVLIQEGIRFTILEPHQAQSTRPIGEKEWQDVADGGIDPRRPYRFFSKKRPDKSIDIFFYDGPISKSVGFENLLFDAKLFMERLEAAKDEKAEGPQLIHVATDGESYGHHKAFGDRALAYMTFMEAPQRGWRLVNYGQFLEENPPQREVRIKPGKDGEGTAWSCAHGVGRWKEDCGCRGDGPPEWNQSWRKGLREALDWLRDELVGVFEAKGGEFFKDAWQARGAYVGVVLSKKEDKAAEFLREHARRELDSQEASDCIKLLEMQRHAMLMYTSCAWFFTELSGIETVQVLQYAARAIQLALEVGGVNLEDGFLERLDQAKSNIDYFKDGRGVYEKLIRPRVGTLEHVVSYYAIGSIFENYYANDEHLGLCCFDLKILYHRKDFHGNLTVNFGRVKVKSKITLEEKDFVFAVLQVGTYDFRCSVKPFTGAPDFTALEKELFEGLKQLHLVDLFRKIDSIFGHTYYALRDLLLEDRMKIIDLLAHEAIDKVSRFYESIYDENRRMGEVYRSINLPVPDEFRFAAEHTLTRRLAASLRQLSTQGYSPRKASAAYHLVEAAQTLNVGIGKEEIVRFLSADFEKSVRGFSEAPDPEKLTRCLNIVKVAKKIGVALDQRQAQDSLFLLIKRWRENPKSVPESMYECEKPFLQLARELELAYCGF